jgi:hypothetical protein
MTQQPELLEHHAAAAPQPGQRRALPRRRALPAPRATPGLRALLQEAKFQPCGLAGAGRAGQEMERPRRQRDRQVAQRGMAIIAETDVFQCDYCQGLTLPGAEATYLL